MKYRSPVVRIAALGLAALASACAARQKHPEVVWPLPPEKPRIRFESAIFSEADLERSTGRRVLDAITGAQPKVRLAQPTGLALSVDEKRLYVTSAAYSKIIRIDLAEQRMLPCEPKGKPPARPLAVAVDAQDEIYVTDQAAREVVVLDAACANIVRRFGSRLLVRPTGIAIDRARGLVYVLDGANKDSDHHAIEVFTTAGVHERSIGHRGDGDGELYFPYGIAVAHDGRIAVSDAMNFRVQLFDSNGSYLSKFGKAGAGYGMFGRLKGVAFDAFDNLHVVDGEFGLVQMFNVRNQVLMFYGGRAPYVEYMDMPTAIAIDSQNSIYVADFSMGAVKKYRLVNTTREDSTAPTEPEVQPARVEKLPSSPVTNEVAPITP